MACLHKNSGGDAHWAIRPWLRRGICQCRNFDRSFLDTITTGVPTWCFERIRPKMPRWRELKLNSSRKALRERLMRVTATTGSLSSHARRLAGWNHADLVTEGINSNHDIKYCTKWCIYPTYQYRYKPRSSKPGWWFIVKHAFPSGVLFEISFSPSF